MSKTYSIGCSRCRKQLWIAQGIGGDGEFCSLYTGMPEVMKALRLFLFQHRGHPLVFDDNIESRIFGWEAIEPTSEPTMSDTPLTDAEETNNPLPGSYEYYRLIELSRKLERESARMRALLRAIMVKSHIMRMPQDPDDARLLEQINAIAIEAVT